MQLLGATALVTGGASGLGLATATRFVRSGANVVLLDLPTSAGADRAAELGEQAEFVATDVTDEDGVQAAVEHAVERFGRIDVAVNCAGVGWAGRVIGREGAHSLELFTTVVRINLIGTFNVLRLAAVAMDTNEPGEGGDKGVIVNTASIAGYDGQIGQAAYAASKGGIIGMTLPIARDLARHQIRVCTIAPGLMDTPLLAGLPEEARVALAADIPHPQRLGDPADFASLAEHIVANPYLNGEVVRLDGALRMKAR
jgi:NAD(P)-dependent dehydrogenase (short-subunit alcohol dehydrogenase family)